MAYTSDRGNPGDLAALAATFRAAAREFAPPAQRRATRLLAAVRDLLLTEPTGGVVGTSPYPGSET